MDALRLFLEQNAQAIVIFFACLIAIFLVIRPLSVALVEFLYRRKIKETQKKVAPKPQKPLDSEMEELLDKAAAKGLTGQERIRRLAQSDPDKAKDLVRSWIHGNENGARRGNASPPADSHHQSST